MDFTGLKNFFLDTLFPSQCVACQKDTSSSPIEEKLVCFSCFEKIPVNAGFFCPNCHGRSADGSSCLSCLPAQAGRGKNPLKKLLIASDYDHEILKKIILAYKYDCVKDLSRPLHNLILKYLERLNFSFDGDFALVAVPLHKSRKILRGFNQAELLARLFSANFNFPLLEDVLIRARHTEPQAEFPHSRERSENVRGAFECEKPEAPAGKKIILVDDVITTGATLSECARVLRRAGAKEVWGLAAAKG